MYGYWKTWNQASYLYIDVLGLCRYRSHGFTERLNTTCIQTRETSSFLEKSKTSWKRDNLKKDAGRVPEKE